MINLSDEAKEILIGSMLGDGSMRFRGKNASFIISRAQHDLEYLEFQFEYFKDLCKTGIVKKSVYDNRMNKYYHKCYFHTLTNSVFNSYYKEWYDNKKKIIPSNIELTPLACSIWFCDDGCITKPSDNTLILKLSTNSFTKNEVEYLADILSQKLKENFFISKVKENQYIISAGTNATVKFIQYIQEYIPKSMSRKIKWNKLDNLKPRQSNKLSKTERETKIFSLLYNNKNQTRIDIASHIDLLCYNKNKKCYYLRQDLVKYIESLVQNNFVYKENIKNINYYSLSEKGIEYFNLLVGKI